MSAETDRAFWLITEFSKGKIKPEEVTVDLAGRSWSYVPSVKADNPEKVTDQIRAEFASIEAGFNEKPTL